MTREEKLEIWNPVRDLLFDHIGGQTKLDQDINRGRAMDRTFDIHEHRFWQASPNHSSLIPMKEETKKFLSKFNNPYGKVLFKIWQIQNDKG